MDNQSHDRSYEQLVSALASSSEIGGELFADSSEQDVVDAHPRWRNEMESDKGNGDATEQTEDQQERFRDDSPHVLLAEDDPDLRRLIATALRLDGFQVIEAGNGRELLDRMCDWLLYRWPFEELDLILSDVRMPGLSGTEVVSSLRRSHWTTPVILMTAYPDPAIEEEARGLGVTSVFSKPFDLDDLRTVVLNTAGSRRPSRAPRERPESRDETFDEIEQEYTRRVHRDPKP